MYASNITESKHLYQNLTELQGQIDISTITLRDFNTTVLLTYPAGRKSVRIQLN